MSGFLWAYLPEICDGDFCPYDCDNCGKAEECIERMEAANEREIRS